MRFFVLLACLVATVFSRYYGGSGYERNSLGFHVPKFTCDRHVVMRCFNVLGDEVDEFGYPVAQTFLSSKYEPHPWL